MRSNVVSWGAHEISASGNGVLTHPAASPGAVHLTSGNFHVLLPKLEVTIYLIRSWLWKDHGRDLVMAKPWANIKFYYHDYCYCRRPASLSFEWQRWFSCAGIEQGLCWVLLPAAAVTVCTPPATSPDVLWDPNNWPSKTDASDQLTGPPVG